MTFQHILEAGPENNSITLASHTPNAVPPPKGGVLQLECGWLEIRV